MSQPWPRSNNTNMPDDSRCMFDPHKFNSEDGVLKIRSVGSITAFTESAAHTGIRPNTIMLECCHGGTAWSVISETGDQYGGLVPLMQGCDGHLTFKRHSEDEETAAETRNHCSVFYRDWRASKKHLIPNKPWRCSLALWLARWHFLIFAPLLSSCIHKQDICDC